MIRTTIDARGYGVLRETLPDWRALFERLLRVTVVDPYRARQGLPPQQLDIWDEEASRYWVYVPRAFGLAHFGLPRAADFGLGARELDFPPLCGELRPAQQAVLERVLAAIEDQTFYLQRPGEPVARAVRAANILLELYCAFGKTVLILELARRLGRPALVVVTTDALAQQMRDRAAAYLPGARVGFLKGAALPPDCHLVICSLQSLIRRRFAPGFFADFGLCVLDEVHTMAAPEFAHVFFRVGVPVMVGVTASVRREDDLHRTLELWLGAPLVSIGRRPPEDRVPVRVAPVRLAVAPELRARLAGLSPAGQYGERMAALWTHPARVAQVVALLERWFEAYREPPRAEPEVSRHFCHARRAWAARCAFCPPDACAQKRLVWTRACCARTECEPCAQSSVRQRRACGCGAAAEDFFRLAAAPTAYDGHHQFLFFSDRVEVLQLVRRAVEACAWAPLCGDFFGSCSTNADRLAEAEAQRQQFVFATFAKAKQGLDMPGCTTIVMLTPSKKETTVVQCTGRNQRKLHADKEAAVLDLVDDEFLSWRSFRLRRPIYRDLGYTVARTARDVAAAAPAPAGGGADEAASADEAESADEAASADEAESADAAARPRARPLPMFRAAARGEKADTA